MFYLEQTAPDLLKLYRSAPHEVEVRFDGRAIDRIRLDDDGWRHVVYPLQRMRSLPRRLEIVVTAGGNRAAVRRIRWGLP